MKRLMLDLETMGASPNAAIVAIGCVEFDESSILKQFYQKVSLQSAMETGGEVDASTILWWMQQDDVARKEITSGDASMSEALFGVSNWVFSIAPDKDAEMWGNGAAFDNVILRSAYQRLGIPAPWSYKNDRCYRTVVAEYPAAARKYYGVSHKAIDDAISQVWTLQEVWQLRELKL